LLDKRKVSKTCRREFCKLCDPDQNTFNVTQTRSLGRGEGQIIQVGGQFAPRKSCSLWLSKVGAVQRHSQDSQKKKTSEEGRNSGVGLPGKKHNDYCQREKVAVQKTQNNRHQKVEKSMHSTVVTDNPHGGVKTHFKDRKKSEGRTGEKPVGGLGGGKKVNGKA